MSAWGCIFRFIDELQGLVGWLAAARDCRDGGAARASPDALDQSIYFDPENAGEEDGDAKCDLRHAAGGGDGVGAGALTTMSSASLDERLMDGPATKIDGRVMPEWRVLLGRPTVSLHTLMVCLSLEEMLTTGRTAATAASTAGTGSAASSPTGARPFWSAAATATPRELNILRWAALLHDIAKMRCGGDPAHPFRSGGVAVIALCRVVKCHAETRTAARAWDLSVSRASCSLCKSFSCSMRSTLPQYFDFKPLQERNSSLDGFRGNGKIRAMQNQASKVPHHGPCQEPVK